MVNPAIAALAGKVVLVEGRVDVLKQGANTATPVKQGDPVNVGDIYRAKSDGKAEIIFFNNNTVKIAPKSRVEIKEYMVEGNKTSNIIKLHRGRVQVTSSEEFVKKVAAFAESNKFEVHTRNAVAGIRGSSMVVSFMQGITSALLVSGIGYQYNPSDPNKATITLTKGTISFVLTVTSSPTPARQATENEISVQIRAVTPTTGTSGGTNGGGTSGTGTITGGGDVIFAASAANAGTASLMETVLRFIQSIFQITIPPPPPTIADTTAPVVTIVSKPDAATNQTIASFSFSTDEPSIIQYRLDSGIWITTGSSLSLSGLADGSHQIEVRATDTLGNVSTIYSHSWTIDTVAPVITFVSKPNAITNQTIASFSFSTSKTSTLQYRIDGGAWITAGSSLSLSGLADGSHQIEVKATDSLGNVSSATTYTWQIDTIIPTIALSPSASPVTNTGNTNVTVNITSSKTATYSYSIDSGAWTTTGASLVLYGLAEGSHALNVKATDSAGNESSVSTLSFELKRHTLDGNLYGTGSTLSGGTTTGDIAGVIDKNWGSFTISTSGGSYCSSGTSSTWQTDAGGQSKSSSGSLDGYWFNTASGSYSGNSMSGTSSFQVITKTTLGTGTGTVTGSHDTSTFSLSTTGSGYTENSLKVFNDFSDSLSYFNGSSTSTGNTLGAAYMGGTSSIWSATESNPASITLIGKYTTVSGGQISSIWGSCSSDMIITYNNTSGKYTTFDQTGGFKAYHAGALASDNTTDARIIGYYVDASNKGGFVKGSLTGNVYPDIGMLKMSGSINQIVEMASGIGFNAEAFQPGAPDSTHDVQTEYLVYASYIIDFSGSLTGGGTISIGTASLRDGGSVFIAGIKDQDWGIWKSYIGSKYSGTISDTWNITMDFAAYDSEHLIYTSIIGTEITGSKWSDGKITGSAVGYGADITSTPKTWISVGNTVGSYDSNAATFQAISVGPWIETNKFLEMAATEAGRAKLTQLGIPPVEVGNFNLTGSGSYGSGSTMSITMNNVKFFSTTSGGAAKIWATKDAGGSWSTSYSEAPTVGTTASLSSGNGVGATFMVKTFDTTNKKWLATITSGSGTINSISTTFRGAGAGTIDTGAKTFSGTASGVAK